MIDPKILNELQKISQEEQAILDGQRTIDRDIYMQGPENVINAEKLLSDGKLITLRLHTRFIHFPRHRHDYVEVVYMCTGQTTHIVNGERIILRQGELLFLGQKATHEIFRAEKDDVAINFIVLPQFFSNTLAAVGDETTSLKSFLVDCLFNQNMGPGYLHFHVSDNKVVQNLVENLLFTLLTDTASRRKVSQMTMTLLFLQLLDNTDKLEWASREDLILKLLRYVEDHYADASLSEAAALLRTDIYTLSRSIRKHTGKTFTVLLQEKRLSQASFYLRNTDRSVDDISLAVGYENISYFHRIFRQKYGVSPAKYRAKK